MAIGTERNVREDGHGIACMPDRGDFWQGAWPLQERSNHALRDDYVAFCLSRQATVPTMSRIATAAMLSVSGQGLPPSSAGEEGNQTAWLRG